MKQEPVNKLRSKIQFLVLLTSLLYSITGNGQSLPRIALNPPCLVSLKMNEFFPEPGYLALDSANNVITSRVEIIGQIDYAKAGRYVLNYCIKDSGLAPVCVSRTILVGDSGWGLFSDSIIPLKVAVGTPKDTLAGILAYLLSTYSLQTKLDSSTVNLNVLGVYDAWITLTDSICGALPLHFRLGVLDEISPEIVLNGPDTLCWEYNKPFVDPWFIVSDNYYPVSVLEKKRIGHVNVGDLGDYLLIYLAIDPSGNQGQKSRLVKVVTDVNNCFSTGIDKIYPNHFRTYPQPVSDLLTLETSGQRTIENIRLSNYLGAEIGAPCSKLEAGKLGIDLSHLPNGIYTLTFENEGNAYSKIIVVIH